MTGLEQPHFDKHVDTYATGTEVGVSETACCSIANETTKPKAGQELGGRVDAVVINRH